MFKIKNPVNLSTNVYYTIRNGPAFTVGDGADMSNYLVYRRKASTSYRVYRQCFRIVLKCIK